jgi:hypothetical protein
LSLIPGGAGAYLLKHILHDRSDEDCLRILKNIYAVAEPGTKLPVVDAVVGARNEHEFAKILDIQCWSICTEKSVQRPNGKNFCMRPGFN